MRTHYIRGVILLALSIAATSASAEDAYYWLGASQLTIVEGKLPQADDTTGAGRFRALSRGLRPYAVLDGAGEVYFDSTDPWQFQDDHPRLAIRAEAGKEVTGRLYVPKADWSGMVEVRFSIPQRFSSAEAKGGVKTQARQMFLHAKYQTYQRLLNEDIPGAAWFRHQLRQASIAMNPGNTAAPEQGRRLAPGSRDDLSETYALFTGGRAISENLQLDRLMPPGRGGSDLVNINSLEGITVAEIDWSKRVKDLQPELDPLAARIPADQHVVFFPNFAAFTRVVDEIRQNGMPVIQLAEPQAIDARTIQRYERQLCISLTGVARLLGPQLVRSVALTGSDANFRTGTDVAFLFETTEADSLERALLAQLAIGITNQQDVQKESGNVGENKFQSARTPDRRISCYIAKVGGAVVVTNSKYQLDRIVAAAGGKTPTLSSLPEFKFFRDRYRRGDASEAALVFLSDATIRRWCGPRWRIASSRQLRDLAVIGELTAAHIDDFAKHAVKPGPIQADLPLATTGEIKLTPTGVHSVVAGSLDFLTPIAEIPLEKVTRGEADAYGEWRRGYQNNWRWAFDPIAVRLTIEADKLAADLSVMPLIWSSEYRPLIVATEGSSLKPASGDPHENLLHVALAINPKSETMRGASGMASMIAPAIGADPLSWLGESIAVYADDDPVWEQVKKIDLEKLDGAPPAELFDLPAALWCQVSNPLKATAFMTGLRAYIEQTSPGMTQWETLTYKDKPYVKVSASDEARREAGVPQQIAVYYSLTGASLVVSLNEQVIQHSIDRRITRQENPTGKEATKLPEWPGQNLAARVDRKFLDVITTIGRQQLQEQAQTLAWRNLPILNEWKRRFPDRDPAELHEQVWKVRLVCPGGGKFVWNEEWQTMESTVYGHPGNPKKGPAAPQPLLTFLKGEFGLTFEDQGLRAKAVLERLPEANDAMK